MLDLALASARDFAGCLNQRFRLASDSATLELELVAASPVGSRAAANGGREPFALLFRGPSDPVLPQRIYRLECTSLGSLDIFLVPIGADAAGVRYEAVFA